MTLPSLSHTPSPAVSPAPKSNNLLFIFVPVLLTILFLGYAPDAAADCATQNDIPQAQCEALEDLYDSVNGDDWNDNSNWLNDNPCDWFGVTCSGGKVSELILTDNGLSGTVGDLTGLTDLVWLAIDYGNLSGALPDISGMQNLEGADFYGNLFTGSIPAWSDLPKITYINVGNNRLTGALPGSLALLPALGFLNVDRNNLVSAVPSSYLESPINSFGYDHDNLCVMDSESQEWLDAIAGYHGLDQELCWTLTADISDAQPERLDRVYLSSGLSFFDVESDLEFDLYLSIALPDGKNEIFVTVVNNKRKVIYGTADPDSWQPYNTNVAFEPGINSGLQPVVAYRFRGYEPKGEYRWIIRATRAGTTDVIQQTEAPLYFSRNDKAAVVTGPEEVIINETFQLQASATSEASGTVYHWDFDDGTTTTGSTVEHSFGKTDRYLVKVTPEVNGTMLPETTYHYINAGRAYANTIYPMTAASLSPTRQIVEDFGWNDCDPNWDVFDGKYHHVLIEASQTDFVDPQRIIDAVSVADYLFESYSDFFGWDVLPGNPAFPIYLCSTIPGGGTGDTGTFFNIEFIDGVSDSVIRMSDLGGLLHEFIHLWDYRAGLWLGESDPAHAFTSGLEPILNLDLGVGGVMTGWGGETNAILPIDGNYGFRHYLRVALNRYLNDPDLSWESYFEGALPTTEYEDLPVPENKEHMMVQGGILMTLYWMHGGEGLHQIFAELEKVTQELGDSEQEFTARQRADAFMKATADGLGLDVSEYFRYWKYPVSGMASYMSIYPDSPMLDDKDGDGFSPVMGDLDDTNNTVYPYAPELVDGVDNSQDGLVDENEYIEADSDFVSQTISLPATALGSISDMEDEDSFTFTLDQATTVYIAIYSSLTSQTVDYASDSNREISVFAGEVYLDGWPYTEIVHALMSAPEGISQQTLSAGQHTITVSPNVPAGDSRNGNPGDYELQIFFNDFISPLTADGLRSQLYPGQ